MIARRIPFEFVLDELEELRPTTKPMFGCTAVYVDGRIVLVLRERGDHPDDNGVWIATAREHHPSLRATFPEMRSIALLAGGTGNETAWQLLPIDSADFEDSAVRACALILRRDPRIGTTGTKKTTKGAVKKAPPKLSKKRYPPAR